MEYVLSHCSKNLLPIETLPSVAFRPTSPQGGLTGTPCECSTSALLTMLNHATQILDTEERASVRKSKNHIQLPVLSWKNGRKCRSEMASDHRTAHTHDVQPQQLMPMHLMAFCSTEESTIFMQGLRIPEKPFSSCKGNRGGD